MTRKSPTGSLTVLTHSLSLSFRESIVTALQTLCNEDYDGKSRLWCSREETVLKGTIWYCHGLPNTQAVMQTIRDNLDKGEWVALAEYVDSFMYQYPCQIHVVSSEGIASAPPVGTINFLAEQLGLIKEGDPLPKAADE